MPAVFGVTLIHRARDAGLRLEVAGNALKITGPKEAEPFVRLLAKRKAQVLEALTNSGLRELRELRKIAPENQQGNLPQSVEEEARRDREHGDAPYASALAELRAKCPAYSIAVHKSGLTAHRCACRPGPLFSIGALRSQPAWTSASSTSFSVASALRDC